MMKILSAAARVSGPPALKSKNNKLFLYRFLVGTFDVSQNSLTFNKHVGYQPS